NKRMRIVSVDSARPAGRMLDCDHQSFPAGILRKILRHERRDLRLLSHRRAGHEAQQNQRNEFDRHSRLFRSLPGTRLVTAGETPGRTPDAGRIDPEQSPYTCMLPEHKPVRRGREMIDLLAVEEPKPKPAKIRAVSYEAAIDQLFKRMRSSSSALTQ